ncbi:hypothetical protein KW790_00775 [Candidatus Parcubacteria bacterium]|nr:hypothetical protein [Candidatus Parcubacteria bacterium]
MNLDPTLINFDLLTVGIATAAIALLGVIVYLNDRKSITTRTFFAFSLLTAIWGISNYFEYQFRAPDLILWSLRLHLFISSLHALLFFQLAYVFPKQDLEFPRWYRYIIVPTVILVALLTLSPLVFPSVMYVAPIGQVTNPERGPGIALFGIVAFGLLFAAVTMLSIKASRAVGVLKKQAIFVFLGMFLTACLIILFNVVLPVTFNNTGFIPFAALFLLPFIGLTSYSIYKYKLFNLKLAAATFIAFLVTTFSFANIIFSKSTSAVAVNITAFIVILIGSIELIRSLIHERQQTEQLQIANEGQTNLIHIMNHQIKGYLSKSKGIFSELLSGDYGAVQSEAKPMLEEGLKSLTEGVDFVRQVLQGSSAESGILIYNFEDIDFRNVVEDVIKTQSENAKSKGLEFKFNAEDDGYKLRGDKLQLKEVVRNLVENSIAYTPEGRVEVSLNKHNGKALLTIKDTGVGIDPEDEPRLFTKGGRGKDSLKVNVNSTGYGLSFVKAVIEAHNGKVWAESEGKGKGSTFYLELALS